MAAKVWRPLLGFVVGTLGAGALHLSGISDPLLATAAGGIGSVVVNGLIFPEDR